MKNISFLILFISISSFGQKDYVQASGKFLTKGTDTIELRGVCFGNEVWNYTEVPYDHHNEADFKRISDLGMNAARFYMNYRTFENDDTPFSYKESGWKWLDQNIKWAKKHNIHLILNMHVPQGGFQSQGEGFKLWEDKNLQARFTKLWKAIAHHYANEPIIAGYDLLNEPGVTESKEQWKALAQKTVNAIRTVDKNHAIIIERVNSIAKSWTAIDEDLNFFMMDDPNIIYTFHFYDPIEYSHQNTPWTGLGEGGKYPDKNQIEFPDDLKWYSANFDNPKFDWGNIMNWKYYTGKPFKVTDEYIKVAKPVLVSDNNSGQAMFNSFVVKEYDPSGKFVRDIMDVEIARKDGWGFWSKDGKGSFEIKFNYGVENKSVLIMKNTSAPATCYNNSLRFIPKYNHSYTISGWGKGELIPEQANCLYRLDFETTLSDVENATRTKEYLEAQIKKFLAIRDKYNVPMYVGEFGLYKDCFTKRKGGDDWVADVLDILIASNLSFTYHAWHEDAFGIYSNSGLPDEKSVNKKLVEVLEEKLK